MNEEYRSYLRSTQWREKRKEFLEMAGYECEECGESEGLQVHHLNYENLGDESEDDVQVLCRECHEDKELEKGTELSYVEYESY